MKIKLRVWDRTVKQMHFVGEDQHDDLLALDDNGSGYIMMLYTGLKDKNGVEIYEGDIVKFRHGGEFAERGIYYRNYAIEFVNTYANYGLRFRNKSVHFPCKQSTIFMHDVEVIGNIHDNPELLKGVE